MTPSRCHGWPREEQHRAAPPRRVNDGRLYTWQSSVIRIEQEQDRVLRKIRAVEAMLSAWDQVFDDCRSFRNLAGDIVDLVLREEGEDG